VQVEHESAAVAACSERATVFVNHFSRRRLKSERGNLAGSRRPALLIGGKVLGDRVGRALAPLFIKVNAGLRVKLPVVVGGKNGCTVGSERRLSGKHQLAKETFAPACSV
jgi:hypothetical protein